jgi:hypothetical protein
VDLIELDPMPTNGNPRNRGKWRRDFDRYLAELRRRAREAEKTAPPAQCDLFCAPGSDGFLIHSAECLRRRRTG